MGQLYASAVGTTVLQIKEIPPRPADLDGVLCLFGVADETDEAAVEAALGRFGTIVAITDRRKPPIERAGEMSVRFTSHRAVTDVIASAKHGLESGSEEGLWEGL